MVFFFGSALFVELLGVFDVGFIFFFESELLLEEDLFIVFINVEIGERVVHFSELDKSVSSFVECILMIRPVDRLDDATRYIVAVRGIQDANGVISATPVFAALRDRMRFDADPSIDQRRGLYADIFVRLEQVGVARADLQLAWDFTTASCENNMGYLLHMRDEVLAVVGDDGLAYTIIDVQFDVDE